MNMFTMFKFYKEAKVTLIFTCAIHLSNNDCFTGTLTHWIERMIPFMLVVPGLG